MTTDPQEKIKDLITKNKVFVFMKGTKLMPMCGFSNNVVQILNSLGVPFETLDVLEDSEIRQRYETVERLRQFSFALWAKRFGN